jgi:hypothetical protein
MCSMLVPHGSSYGTDGKVAYSQISKWCSQHDRAQDRCAYMVTTVSNLQDMYAVV